MVFYSHARVFTGECFLANHAVGVQDHSIACVVPEREVPNDAHIIDLEGHYLVPGFVDIQLYGGSRSFFVKDLDETSLDNIVASHRIGGTMSLIPTLNSTTIERILKAIDVTKNYIDSHKKGVIGLHIEGPYINVAKRGAHVAEVIRVPTADELETIINRCKGLLTIITIAPEIWPQTLLKRLFDSDIIVSVGHTNGTYKELKAFFDAYAHKTLLATHLFNAMRPLEGREPGVVGAIFDDKNVCASIIADGYHCDFASIRIAKNQLKERLFLISDAVGVHCEIDRYELDDFNANFKGDHFVNDAGTLAGSAITQIDSLKNCVQKVGIDLAEALRMVSTYPAQYIGLGQKFGKIAPNYTANMVVLTDDLRISKVICDS
jgi:N-acetylglucosamine-6-phosphate deacetylase